MISVDFREHTLARRFAAIMREPALRGILVAVVSVALLAGIESARLFDVCVRAIALEGERDKLLSQARTFDVHLAADREMERTLQAAQALRTSNLLLAGKIARLGNALSPPLALLTLRVSQQGWSIEGQARSLADLQATLLRDNLHSMFGVPEVFEVRRSDVGEALSFLVQFASLDGQPASQ